MSIGSAALLLLGDGRLPAGGYAHSGGVEEAVRDGRVHDEASLRAFVVLRLATTGTVDASVAAAVAADPTPDRVAALDAEAEARVPSPAQRTVSRRLGRQLLRTAGRIWPSAVLAAGPPDAHLGVALGLASAAAGLGPYDAALLAGYHTATTATSAAVRLLGLDPVAAHALVAALAPDLHDLATRAAATATADPAGLPGPSAPLLELAAERHHARKERLFAS